MSTLQNQNWPSISKENLSSKYEKCRNITEEIYKRINITFQIKKLETATQSDVSDHSDQIDSNELSNETDLFACDKSDSLPSSTEPEKPAAAAPEKYININNNEETQKKAAAVYKRPKKRFRKRVKKRQPKPHSDSDGSSDEALPLSRVVELDKGAGERRSASPDHVGVPKIVIVTKDLKPKILSPEKKPRKKNLNTKILKQIDQKTFQDIEKEIEAIENKAIENIEDKIATGAIDNEAVVLSKRIKAANMSVAKTDKLFDTVKVVLTKEEKVIRSKLAKDIPEVNMAKKEIPEAKPDDAVNVVVANEKRVESKNCTMCSLTFRGERGLRRHVAMSHITVPEDLLRSGLGDVKQF